LVKTVRAGLLLYQTVAAGQGSDCKTSFWVKKDQAMADGILGKNDVRNSMLLARKPGEITGYLRKSGLYQ